jgi:subtilisin family serine protease
MRLRIAIGLLAVTGMLTACVESSGPGSEPTALGGTTPRVIPGQYIVVYKDNVADATAVTKQLFTARGITPLYTYGDVLRGAAVRLTDEQVTILRDDPNVALVEPDQEYTVQVTQNMDAAGDPWGIDRIDEVDLPLSRTYTYTATGAGVRVYIIDTGIQTSHSQFGGRASAVYDAFGGNGQDCHGHGTHVAGTVGGSTYGVAKGALLRAVRVLNCSGSGSTSGIIAGLNWVRTNHIKPAAANMSLGGGFSSSLNTAVNNLSAAGVFVAVAAGNSNANACNSSPASATGVFSTASSTRTDAKSSFSNSGSCVDGYAPGSAIKSAWLNGGTNTISGTSMASPHVAGVAALYKSANGDASQTTIQNFLISTATLNHITGNPSGTANRLLFKGTL